MSQDLGMIKGGVSYLIAAVIKLRRAPPARQYWLIGRIVYRRARPATPATIGPRACRSHRAMELGWSRQWAVTRPRRLASQGACRSQPQGPAPIPPIAVSACVGDAAAAAAASLLST
ncbi:hypothetical protein ASPNIDRAFT_42365 [Aspergillus niger ATCC 1015]|uniref:Uncharacterized protein n=1 Tax=Aspergillus niger (strain ATCC 1015 / CBS 113.46 / FGSC A1144 / LSHB Ac4 / NCTC 3858a / NRRL 328 / USDA 3528.7) TaxID=380704 RepID=G3XVM2_ASPNA|nr:uncharacterized protein BO96DRAFT_351864 [Aspergillus niger CBS 101883]EHA25275.1 hypothetical protein ASPNIDRAFT_42365 [Aspergillus niger ATCC 1015]PYH50724.1 hypothetical protein BO96DRAFT_351864 [Aspergillus niger CBS 101883]